MRCSRRRRRYPVVCSKLGEYASFRASNARPYGSIQDVAVFEIMHAIPCRGDHWSPAPAVRSELGEHANLPPHARRLRCVFPLEGKAFRDHASYTIQIAAAAISDYLLSLIHYLLIYYLLSQNRT